MKIIALWIALLSVSIPWSSISADTIEESSKNDPLVLGEGLGLFEIGPLLAEDDFGDLTNWVVQLQSKDGFEEATVHAKSQTLDCFVPGRGCTVWFKQKLRTRVVITYDVICPVSDPTISGVIPTDINNFWMATDRDDPEHGLFDSQRFSGAFGSYDKMRGYYASTGGGKNTTTRMRRYPRELDGKPTEHLALTHRDGNPDFLITPDKVMRIQLIAYDDLIQYIVDGKLVYEIASGDEVTVEDLDTNGKRVTAKADYNRDRFPSYKEGFFGFRMVGTHHIYSNFQVHALEPARTNVEVSSVRELREVSGRSDQRVVMKPGSYVISDLIDGQVGIHLSGSNNHFDFTGVTIRTPISTYRTPEDDRRRRGRRRRGFGTIQVTGDHVSLNGGTFENTYAEPKGPIKDFGNYNQDPSNYPAMGVTEMRLAGDDIQVTDCKFTVRGSYPYGYGNIYGIGGDDPALALRKHCGILVTGDRVLLDGCKVKMEAFGHAIYVQGGDQVTVRNTEVEGEVRPSNDFYRETNEGDLAEQFDHRIQWPENMKNLPVPKDHMINLMEDGIRAYNGTGHMTVENCKVTKARGGIKLYMAKSATVSDCEVRDCVIQGYSLPSKGTITRSRGNAAYGPLLYVHMDSHSSQTIDLEVLPASHALGDHPLAAIKGKDHRITFTSKEPVPRELRRPIIVGYPLRFDYLCVDFPKVPDGMQEHFENFAPNQYQATRIQLDNHTEHPVIMGKFSEENRLRSKGKITDYGKGNLQVPPLIKNN